MATAYECEVRIFIKDIAAFQNRLTELNAKLEFPYEFTDYYYKPKHAKWDPVKKNIRIRDWKYPDDRPTAIYLVQNEIMSQEGLSFKRSIYPEGKLSLFEGSLDVCKKILHELEFVQWFTVLKDKSKIYSIPAPEFWIAVEYIKQIGWVAELEFDGTDPHKASLRINEALEALRIDKKQVTYNPVSAIISTKTL